MVLNKNDFVEIEFTGKTKEGTIFDSNIKKDLDESGLKQEAKPFRFALGQKMFLEGVEDFLIGKDVGEYKIELSPEKAFGERQSNLIKIMPRKVFQNHQLNPVPGAMFNFDGQIGKVLSVSGGRITVDFNHPIAGKEVIYEVKVLRKIEDLNERINSFIEFLFRKPLDFEVKDKKIILKVEEQLAQFVGMFEEKFKEIFDLGLEVQKVKTNLPEKDNKTQ